MTEPKKVMDPVKEARSLGFIIFIAILIRILIVEPFFIPSPSMNDTLLEGDYIFSTKYSYGYSKHSMLFFTPDSWNGRVLINNPERGDVVIFRPPHAMHMRFIKRLIGIPGDKVQVINNVVYVNDKPLPQEFVTTIHKEDGDYKQYVETAPNGAQYHILEAEAKDQWSDKLGNTQVFQVPEDSYFFMGDNRKRSNDSRADLGFVPFENFIAKAQFIYFSDSAYLWLSEWGVKKQFEQIYHWFAGIRLDRMFKSVYSL